MTAKNTVCPDLLITIAGTPDKLTGLAGRVLHCPHERPFPLITAAAPAVVTQKTCAIRLAPMTGTGVLVCHPIQRPLSFALCCRITSTLPSLAVWNTATWPVGNSSDAGSVPILACLRGVGNGLPHSQSLGNPACCHACTSRPALSRANIVSPPSACGATVGLLAIVAGERPTACMCDQVRLPTGTCHECARVLLADRANHSAVLLAFMATAMRNRAEPVGLGAGVLAPPRFTSSLSLSISIVTPP